MSIDRPRPGAEASGVSAETEAGVGSEATPPAEALPRPPAGGEQPRGVAGAIRRGAAAASPPARATLADRLRLPRQPLLRHLILAVGGLVIIYILTSLVTSYENFVLSQIGAYLIAVAGLTILTGLNGQISLGNGAFMGIGAYVTALLMLHTHQSLAVVLITATVAAAVSGAIVGIGAARLRGPYLAGATLALAVALPSIPLRWPHLLGGDTGLSVNPPTPPSFLGVNFNPQRWLAWITGICAVLTLIVLANLVRSRYGRSFRTVRDDEIAASLSGIHVARTQILAFVVSAACAGLGGALFGLGTGIVNPAGFPLTLSIALLTAMVIGGLGSLLGAVWGAILIVYLPQWATSVSDSLHLSKSVSSNLAFAFYGIVLIVAMLVFPGGIQGGLRRLADSVRARRARSVPE